MAGYTHTPLRPPSTFPSWSPFPYPTHPLFDQLSARSTSLLRLQHGANIGRRHAYHFAFAGFSRLFTFYLTWPLTALWRPAMIPTRLSSHHLDSQRHSVRRLSKRPQLSTDNKASDGCETFAKSTARLLSAPASLIWFLGTRRKDNEDAAPLCRTQAPHIHPVGSAPDNMAHIGTFNHCRAQSSLSNAPLANRLPARNFFFPQLRRPACHEAHINLAGVSTVQPPTVRRINKRHLFFDQSDDTFAEPQFLGFRLYRLVAP